MNSLSDIYFPKPAAPCRPLNTAEKAWLIELDRLLQRCPSTRLAAATSGDAKLIIYDKDLERFDDDAGRSEDFIPYCSRAGIILCRLPMPFQVASTAA